MSFILDALKKSEMERQRQTVPGLMDTRVSQRRARLPVWAIALCVLLGVNLLVLSFVLWRKNPAAARPSPPPEVTSAHNAAAPPAATEHFSPLDATPVYAPEIPVATGGASAASQPPAIREGAGERLGNAAVHPVHHSDPVLNDSDAQDDNQEVLPTISEISLTGAQTLPELHLDVHVYATRAADRFVYINMRKYHQGATLQDGPTIERIRRDGVVLNYQGMRFLLPRQP
jgi:general secretion pathway protein B